MDHNGNPIYDHYLSNFSLPSVVDSNINNLLIDAVQQEQQLINLNNQIDLILNSKLEIVNYRLSQLENENNKLKEIIKHLLGLVY
jgi:predicted nuclease with TOPRIM domain